VQQRTKPGAAGDEPPLALIPGFRLEDEAHCFGVFLTSRRTEKQVAIGSMVGVVAAVLHDTAAGMGVRIWSRASRAIIESVRSQTLESQKSRTGDRAQAAAGTRPGVS
jgi:hypothetical protein